MRVGKTLIVVWGLLVLGAAWPGLCGGETLTPAEVRSLARDIYYFAYPLVLMDITREQAVNVPDATTLPGRAPANQFGHFRQYPKAENREVVRLNFDTLYSSAWLDLTGGPVVLSIPDAAGRYYLTPLLDMWTDVFAVPGTRTTGGKARNFAIAPPGWSGKLPERVELIVAPTPLVWIIGRTQTNGPADYEAVQKVQDGFELTPLAEWGKDYQPPRGLPVNPAFDGKTPPVVQVNNLNGIAMFGRLAKLLKTQPPHANDYPILMRMRAIGLEPGKSFALADDFDGAKLGSPIAAAVNAGADDALKDMLASVKNFGTKVNGWSVLTDNVGTYGTSYRQRAIVALAGLGANLPADAIYPTAFVDGEGKPLGSPGKYSVHFEKGQLPPADAFWSLTMYDSQSFPVANPIDRFALGDRDKLQTNPDGSLDIYFQSDSPGKDREANWLPAPKTGPFNVTLRIYMPRREALNGSWMPPPIVRAR